MTRNGMRGFSAGILITCAVFAFFYFLIFNNGQTATKGVVKQTPLTDAAVTQYLTNHNRKAIDINAYNQWMASSNASAAGQTKNKANSAPSSSKPQPAQNKTVSYNLKITSGMTPGDISTQLVNAKILKSDQKLNFDQYLHNSKLEAYVQLGSFNVSSDMSIQKIAQVITNNH